MTLRPPVKSVKNPEMLMVVICVDLWLTSSGKFSHKQSAVILQQLPATIHRHRLNQTTCRCACRNRVPLVASYLPTCRHAVLSQTHSPVADHLSAAPTTRRHYSCDTRAAWLRACNEIHLTQAE